MYAKNCSERWMCSSNQEYLCLPPGFICVVCSIYLCSRMVRVQAHVLVWVRMIPFVFSLFTVTSADLIKLYNLFLLHLCCELYRGFFCVLEIFKKRVYSHQTSSASSASIMCSIPIQIVQRCFLLAPFVAVSNLIIVGICNPIELSYNHISYSNRCLRIRRN